MKKVLFVLAIAACTVACAKKAENKECQEQKPCCEQKVEEKAEPAAAAVATEEEKTLKETAEGVAKDILKAGGAKATEEIKK